MQYYASRRPIIPSLPVYFPSQSPSSAQDDGHWGPPDPSKFAGSRKDDSGAEKAAAHDLSGVADTLRYYGQGDVRSGDAALATRDPMVRDAVEWTLIRFHPDKAGLDRVVAFLRSHPDWPTAQLRKRAEELAGSQGAKPDRAAAYFAEFPPTTAGGRLVYAELLRNDPARADEAAQIARDLWRGSDLGPALEKRLLKNFSGALTVADKIFRLDRLMEREQYSAASRAAALAGKDGRALYRAESDLAHGASWTKVARRAPASLRGDPGLLYMRIHSERHANHIDEAAKLMLAAPRDPAVLASPDDWWVERRLLARKLLDAGENRRAYQIAAEHAPASNAADVEAEFTAGWIALRFLNDPALAAPHFDKLAQIARTPHSIARATYWQGRAAEARGQDAKRFYARAANETETFYGQMARAKLGEEPVMLRPAPTAAQGESRAEVVRAVQLLFDLGEQDAARRLALESASTLTDPTQMAALSQLIEAHSDAHTALIAGKAALHRGLAIDSLAFPLNGVPQYSELANSASRPVVLAIARQESAFNAVAKSGAGAFGLMQMIESTARKAAQSAGVAYDEQKLKSDAAFSAQLGAFHLGQLLTEYRGNYILAFAAYNAGGGNVGDWIKAYGDPRAANVDPIDWIERIPFTETRYYVEKIIENLHIYRARLDDPAPDLVAGDLRQTVAARE
ncbi:lytic transglycosylase domain-containing protein [Rhodoblastus acidophilus]|uniref:Lytic transglycosylase domain-containing protein n=1 Tax=Candidatus Rhodoblastus alkanivorans TaxID=2954117 RepID=A0ABS9Z5S3_9HYPH|nr:lytic transglycosylase domain-containing protein [Candidatus Rhodoblastus alkanivorans]MCI4680106.1 lytic transglycosylase domain-containing protein [Candidatus Rhodoblastus alkanivorans]MCI4682984.1 lytic transglycosylase domain-containing protein [Candidatus Rhodoblastus alkanivorans]MDI4640294.1 lytic transglycosylase domain-containing protein [Rhodoblastus acidophilus]